MKKLTVFALLSFLFSLSATSQIRFVNHACPNEIYALAEEGNYIWIGTTGGLYKRHKTGTLVSVYNTTNGLVDNNVTCITIDPQGNKWIGTYNGLAKFDGNVWTSYRTSNSGLSEDRIASIAIDYMGNKWIGTNGGGLVKYNDTTWTVYTTGNSGLANNWVRSIATDNNGALLIGTQDGISVLSGNQWSTIDSVLGQPITFITKIGVDPNGLRWVSTINRGIFSFDGITWTNYTNASTGGLLGSNMITGFTFENGNIWVATLFSGLSVFNGSTWQKYTTANSGIVSDEVKCVLADAQGTKWIGTISGMSKFFGSNWFTIRILDALASSNLNDIAVDNQNSKWFGTQRGLSKFDGLNWSTFTALDGLPDNTILSVDIDSLNRKWVCTPDQGVGMYNDTNFFQFNTGNCGILSDETRSILCDRNNTYWIGTADGLSRFKGGWTNYTTFNSGINTGAIYDMARDQSGYLWLVHTEYGISRFNGLAQWVIYNEANSALPTNYVNAVAIDNNNDKWFATDSGLVKLDAGCSVWTVYNTSNSLLPDNKVLSVAIDTFNNVWCGTNSGGLAKFTGSQWAIYTTTDGLCSNYITTLAVDNENVKWAGSSSGASMGFCENPLPAFVSDIACYPDSSHLSSTSLRVDATSKYFWDFYINGTLDYTTPTVTHQFPLYGFFPVKLLVTNDNCYNTLLQADTVSSQPDVTITTSGNISFCSGDSVNLLADIVNYDSIFNYHYLWSNGAITPNIYVFNPGNYSVTVSNYNCSGASDTVIHVSVYHPYANENICLVTVDSATSMNRIVWEKTPDVGTAFYNVYKETAANYYVPIGNVAFDQPSEFLDVNSDASVKSDRYKISVVDTCGNESALSSAHKTMHLTVNLGTNNQHNLIWEKYEGFPYGQFKVWRAIPPAGWIQIATIQSNIFSYTDTANIPGSVDYVIEINKGDTCFTDLGRASSGTYTTSVSNMEQYRLIGVNEHSGSAKLVLYPNPAGSLLHLRGTEGGTLLLTDATGRTVKAQPNTGSVDVSTLERGVYFVTVTTTQGVATGRFVKE